MLDIHIEHEHEEETEAEKTDREARQWAAVVAEIESRFSGSQDVNARFATREDVINAGITDIPVKSKNARYADREIKPRAYDLEKLSSAGHGRVKEVVNGIIVYEAQYRNWQLHGENSPAVIKRDGKTGAVTLEAWMKDGRLHRKNAPAAIKRDAESGVVIRESWCIHDKIHRFDGPASIRRDAKTGKVTAEHWWLMDTEIEPKGRIGRALVKAIGLACDRLALP